MISCQHEGTSLLVFPFFKDPFTGMQLGVNLTKLNFPDMNAHDSSMSFGIVCWKSQISIIDFSSFFLNDSQS